MNRRSGITLLEVLVAIFVMGIGMLALMALFPLAAMNMSQSIKDDRTAHCAADARSVALTCPAQAGVGGALPLMGFQNDPLLLQAMLNPGFMQTVAPWNNPLILPDRSASPLPSYAVLVDPIGWKLAGGPLITWNGTAPPLAQNTPAGSVVPATLPNAPLWVAAQQIASFPTGMPRVSPRFVNDPGLDTNLGNAALAPMYGNEQVQRWFGLHDDLTFTDMGTQPQPATGLYGVPLNITPAPAAGGPPPQIQSEGRYSWAYLVRLPQANQRPPAGRLDVKIIVYNNRPTTPTTAGQLPENAYQATFTAGVTTVPVVWAAGQDKPAIRRGSWILDGTLSGVPFPHGFFYRVIGVTDTGPNSMDVELQIAPASGNGTAAGGGVLIVLDGVVEVFPPDNSWFSF